VMENWKSTRSKTTTLYSRKAMRQLFPGFDETTAHLAHPQLLPNVRYLSYYGDEIHWALLKSPRLRTLVFERACNFLPDMAPQEVNHALEVLTITYCSSALNPGAISNIAAGGFLAHFPSLECIFLDMRDSHRDDAHMDTSEDLSSDAPGSYAVLLAILQPVVASLRNLYIKVDSYGHDPAELAIMRHDILPSEGFQEFKSLRVLTVPYGCLFGPANHHWPHGTPTPPELLAPSIFTLEIAFPRIAIFDWLARLPCHQDKLPNLMRIELMCSDEVGDSYEVFQFLSHSHRVWAALRNIGIELALSYCEDWDDEWDDYDLEALDLAAWQDSFQGTNSGKTQSRVLLIIY
jgi:hypothetical protein